MLDENLGKPTIAGVSRIDEINSKEHEKSYL
jgi:hypothetical protein